MVWGMTNRKRLVALSAAKVKTTKSTLATSRERISRQKRRTRVRASEMNLPKRPG
jgi:hypothetical protein